MEAGVAPPDRNVDGARSLEVVGGHDSFSEGADYEGDVEGDDDVEVLDQPQDVHRYTAGECLNHFAGQCPVDWCRYHLDCMDRPTLRVPEMTRDPMGDTCSLRLATQQPRTLEEIAEQLGLTRERVRQIEYHSIRKVGRALVRAQVVGPAPIVGRPPIARRVKPAVAAGPASPSRARAPQAE